MHGNTTRKSIKTIYRTLLAQFVILLILAAVLATFSSIVRGYSALLGGGIYLVPTFYFARKVLHASARKEDVRQTLRSFYKSEIWKMALTAVLFGVVFATVRPLDPFSLFGAFILLQLSSLASPLIQNSKIFKS